MAGMSFRLLGLNSVVMGCSVMIIVKFDFGLLFDWFAWCVCCLLCFRVRLIAVGFSVLVLLLIVGVWVLWLDLVFEFGCLLLGFLL